MNIKEFAKELGLSISTVSKALNGKKDVSEEVRKKVEEYAEQVGYSPNPLGRKLAMKKTNTIGVFIVSRDAMKLNENYAIEFLDGIAKKAQEYNYDLLLFTATYTKNRKNSYMKLCKEKKVEGVIFIGLGLQDENLEEIREANIPVSVIDITLEGEKVCCISTDNKKGITLAVNYCLKMGHKKIGFIKSCDDTEVGLIRYNTYKKIMEEKNIYESRFVVQGDFSKESGYASTKLLIEKNDLPTAIIAANDLMALGAIKAFKEAGIRVPEDVSVVGYDNILAAEYSEPELTTIGQNALEIGAQAVDYIIKGTELKNKFLEPTLVIRKSVKKLEE